MEGVGQSLLLSENSESVGLVSENLNLIGGIIMGRKKKAKKIDSSWIVDMWFNNEGTWFTYQEEGKTNRKWYRKQS